MTTLPSKLPKVKLNLIGWPMILLTMLLVTFKATGLIDLAWIWVFVPLWGGIALVLALVAVVLAIALIVVVVAGLFALIAALLP